MISDCIVPLERVDWDPNILKSHVGPLGMIQSYGAKALQYEITVPNDAQALTHLDIAFEGLRMAQLVLADHVMEKLHVLETQESKNNVIHFQTFRSDREFWPNVQDSRYSLLIRVVVDPSFRAPMFAVTGQALHWKYKPKKAFHMVIAQRLTWMLSFKYEDGDFDVSFGRLAEDSPRESKNSSKLSSRKSSVSSVDSEDILDVERVLYGTHESVEDLRAILMCPRAIKQCIRN